MRLPPWAMGAALLTVASPASAVTLAAAVAGAPVMDGPGMDAQVVATLPEGEPLEVVGCATTCRVRHKGSEGWMRPGDFRRTGGAPLKRVSATPKVAPPR